MEQIASYLHRMYTNIKVVLRCSEWKRKMKLSLWFCWTLTGRRSEAAFLCCGFILFLFCSSFSSSSVTVTREFAAFLQFFPEGTEPSGPDRDFRWMEVEECKWMVVICFFLASVHQIEKKYTQKEKNIHLNDSAES